MNINFSRMIVAGLAMLFCLCGSVNAQNSKLCLRDIDSDLEGDYRYYGYNKDGSLDSVYSYYCYYDQESYRLYRYDEKGNMIKEEGYGILPDNKFFSKVFEVFYEFDENNRMISRKNYNIDEFSANLDFILGGVYTYEYDGKGQLKQRNLYWDEAKTDLFEKTMFAYDDNDRLVRETYISNGFYGESEDMTVEYYYDEKGRVIEVVTKTLDANSGALEETGNTYYVYDENDNLLSRTSYDNLSEEIPSEKHILLYNDTLASDVSFPINYEDDMDFFVKSKHVVRQDSIYKRDVEGVVFQLFDIQDWKYEQLEGSTGIESVINPSANISFLRDNDGNIIVGGLENNENVRVYDADGRLIRNQLYNGKVNVSALPHGMYILITRHGNMKFSK